MVSIAIDGPAGAGKSTIARAASKELGYIYTATPSLPCEFHQEQPFRAQSMI